MKRIILLITTALLLVNCSKEHSSAPRESPSSQFTRLGAPPFNIDSLRNWYIHISQPEERLSLWQSHFQYINSLHWTEIQTSSIDEILPYLTLETFSNPTDGLSTRMFLEEWLDRNASNFSMLELYAIVGVPTVGQVSSIPSLGGGMNQTLCECSQDSDYCGWPVGGSSQCDKPCEVDSSWGCGSLWLYSCDGSCI